jgi:hypothetical protein
MHRGSGHSYPRQKREVSDQFEALVTLLTGAKPPMLLDLKIKSDKSNRKQNRSKKCTLNKTQNSFDQTPPLKANSRSATQQIPHLSRNPKADKRPGPAQSSPHPHITSIRSTHRSSISQSLCVLHVTPISSLSV